MSQVLNTKERNKAITQFLIFFLLTNMLIVGAIYFNTRVPVQENASLREEIALQRKEDFNQQGFVAQIPETLKYLDSLEKTGINLTLVNLQLAGKLADLEKFQQRDSSLYGKLNTVIIEAFLELQRTKKELIDLRVKADRLEETEAKLKENQQRLDGYLQAYGQLSSR